MKNTETKNSRLDMRLFLIFSLENRKNKDYDSFRSEINVNIVDFHIKYETMKKSL